MKLVGITSFEDFLRQADGEDILMAYGKIQPSLCLEYSHDRFFSFAEGYSEVKLNQDIANNMELFDVIKTSKFYYPNTNMFSGDNSMTGIKGDILRIKK